jgi:glycosyltransferase involved in cell wall biosynthesis
MVVHGPYPIGEPRVAREAAAARDDGWEVDVVAMRRKGEPARENVDGVAVFRLPVEHVRGAGIGRVLLEYILFAVLATVLVARRAVVRAYAIVHVHSPPDFLVVAAMIPRFLGCRVVLDIHDRSPDMFAMRFPGGAGRVAAAVLTRIERLAGGVADAVVTVHEPYRRELLAGGLAPEKVTVVMNSLDERLMPAPRRPTPAPLRVVYHGTVTPPYGVHLVVEAVALAAERGLELSAEIIGEGDSVTELEQRVAALGISNLVAVDGRHSPHQSVLERVSAAAVGVVPNLPTPLNRFALSSKLFEYVVLEVPVVSAALPTIREHFDDSELLFFRPGDAHSLADALVRTARDPAAARARALNARRRYEAYSWAVNGDRYRALLARLARR